MTVVNHWFYFFHFIASLSPSVLYGRLEQFTELVVSPKHRAGDQQLPFFPLNTNLQNEHQFGPTSSSSPGTDPFNETVNNQPDSSQSHGTGSQSGMGDLKSLLRYMFTGRFEPLKDLPEVPVIPTALQECVLRVCGSQPASICHLDASYGDVHVFPWDYMQSDGRILAQPFMTYGRLSKINSPKEVREQTKQKMEKKRINSVSQAEGVEQEQPDKCVVVRMICHNVQKLQMDQECSDMGQLYCGKVWVSSKSKAIVKLI